MKNVFLKQSFFSFPASHLFEFHERKDAFKLLTPEDMKIEVLSTASTLRPSDDIVRFKISIAGIPFNFAMVHTKYSKPNIFVDEQLSGPFTSWKHRHIFNQGGWHKLPSTMLTDEISYSHPLLPLINPFVKSSLKTLFKKRHEITRKENPIMNTKSDFTVGITGATGLIGQRLIKVLLERKVNVIAFVRNPSKASSLFGESVECVKWDFSKPAEMEWKKSLHNIDALVHLAGAPLFSKRWSKEFKREIEESRTLSTRTFIDEIKRSNPERLKTYISASAVGYYGTDKKAIYDETGRSSDDFLSTVCVNWENESEALDQLGVRRVLMRIGVVLSKDSGALKEMLPLFRFGGGAILGDPKGWINWIHIEDVARMFEMAIFNEKLSGPMNAVSPNPVSNRNFSYAIAATLSRPCFFRLPTFFLKTAIGEAGGYASGGPRVQPEVAEEHDYDFFFTNIKEGLKNLLVSS